MNETLEAFIVFAILILVFLVMLVTPTPTPTPTPAFITVLGSVTTPAGISPNGTVINMYNDLNLLVGSVVVDATGNFQFTSTSNVPGTFRITATKAGTLPKSVLVGLGSGNNNVGVIALERTLVSGAEV